MAVKIGMMSFAHLHAASYAAAIKESPLTELVGIADHDLARAREMARQYGTTAFDSYEALLAAELDAVVITSENVRHAELAVMAAQAGRHILCEKPLATTVEDGKRMIAAARDGGVQLMTAFPCRFSPAMGRVKDAVAAGQVGELVALRGTNRGRCPFGWFVERGLSGGGAVIDHTVHVTDLMRWLTGAEVTQVYAETSNLMLHQGFEDTGFLTMELSNGVFATLDSSWSRPKSYPTWGDVTMSVVGRTGTLTLDMFAQNLVLYSDKTGGTSWIPWGSNIDLLMIEGFARAVAAGEPVPVTGEDGLRAVEVALAAYRSSEAGKPVTV